jgi:hypothetical protein
MKKILMAALVLTTLATGRAYAGDPEECQLPKKPGPSARAYSNPTPARGEGGCILPRPPKKSQTAVAGKATPRPLVLRPVPPKKPCGCPN